VPAPGVSADSNSQTATRHPEPDDEGFYVCVEVLRCLVAESSPSVSLSRTDWVFPLILEYEVTMKIEPTPPLHLPSRR
jgi:hypothetical protein